MNQINQRSTQRATTLDVMTLALLVLDVKLLELVKLAVVRQSFTAQSVVVLGMSLDSFIASAVSLSPVGLV